MRANNSFVEISWNDSEFHRQLISVSESMVFGLGGHLKAVWCTCGNFWHVNYNHGKHK